MSKYFLSFVFVLVTVFGANAQSGAKFSTGVSSIHQDFLSTKDQFTGWNIRLSARLGGGVWFFSPELNYENYNVLPSKSRNPYRRENPRIHTLKVPLGIGWKFKTLPFQKLFLKGGVIGSYVLIIDENDTVDFRNIVDIYGSYYATIGYDFGPLTIDYRYEKSIMNNYINLADSKLLFHSLNIGVNF